MDGNFLWQGKKWLSQFYYPQYIFAQEILKYLPKHEQSILVDCPCGNGETSFYFAKHTGLTVRGFDIDKKSIERAASMYRSRNLSFEVKDIQSVIAGTKEIKYYTLINSLFLLPDPDNILANLYNALNPGGKVCVIVPNIKGKNYRNFIDDSRNQKINGFELSPSELAKYFEKFNFEVLKIKEIVHAHFYGRNFLKKLSVFSHFYLLFSGHFNKLVKRDGNYFLIVLSKTQL
jgi:trans-aconitate methyltransferase